MNLVHKKIKIKLDAPNKEPIVSTLDLQEINNICFSLKYIPRLNQIGLMQEGSFQSATVQ